MDRNGKLVTKHVRAVPASKPKLANAPAPTVTPKQGVTKPTAKQLTPREMDFRAIIDLDGHLSVVKASDAEFYDVMSVSRSSKQGLIAMVRYGCRSKDDALEVLAVTGENNELADHSALTQEALKRRIKPEDFVDGLLWTEHKLSLKRDLELDVSTPEGISRLLDTVELYASPLRGATHNQWEWEAILKDEISFDDIKSIGVQKLKAYDRMTSLSSVLKDIHKGDADYTIDDVKRLVDREIDEKKTWSDYSTRNNQHIFMAAAEALRHRGTKFIDNAASLYTIERQYAHYMYNAEKYKESSLWDRIEYATLIVSNSSPNINHSRETLDQMFEAGIPLETAVEVLSAGGGVLEAKAIHGGINKSVAGGWL